jgi:hypothetical protein
LHGLYLVLNHGWRHIKPQAGGNALTRAAGVLLTFLCVVVAWVFFRAPSLQSAFGVLRAMAGLHGLDAPAAPYISNTQMLCLPLLMALCWFAPNAYQFLGRHSPALEELRGTSLVWKPSLVWAVPLGMLGALCISQMLTGAPSEFIYFQF